MTFAALVLAIPLAVAFVYVSTFLFFVTLLIPMLAFIWFFYRIIRGMLVLNEGNPYPGL